MQTSYPVVICGAGPTGLMMAAQLLRFNIDFLIVDKKAAPTNESRAVVVQAKSMEIYEQLNLSDEILSDAIKTDGLCFWRNGRKISHASFKNFGSDITQFDFLLIYEQSKNELLLYNYLRKNQQEVEWNTEFIAYRKEGEGFIVSLKKENNTVEIEAQYLIACDGGNSALRMQALMPFTGGTYEHVFYVADTHIHANICRSSLNFFVARDTFNLFFPMLGEKRYRAIGILPKEYYHKKEITYQDVSQQVDKDAGMDLGFYETQWYSTYKLHHKKVKAFNIGNLFFCGDAAHVHSPAGGQGMNTGLQDAYNLAWKLAMVIQQKAKPNLLSTYHEERNPVAENLLRTTDRLFSLMSQDQWFNALMRQYIAPTVAPVLLRIKALRRRFFLLASQVEINYLDSSLAKGKCGKLKAGMRFPYFNLLVAGKSISVFHLIRDNSLLPLLLFYFNISRPNFNHPSILEVEIEHNNFNEQVLRKVGFTSCFVCLIRPDNYIAYLSESFNDGDFQQFIKMFLYDVA
ncbi:FAD-dependent monooxygenase [Arachidicoccus sp.]|uniref:FAD-dependent monooxygenase n=1 Tax=Arachidicoccus sp. TaxID=1872624 RepID=UPI003D1F559C